MYISSLLEHEAANLSKLVIKSELQNHCR